MSTMTSNGQVRKSLAGQIDRLDQLLDGLADGLNEAVAAAVTEAVSKAVKVALIEILSHPELQQRLQPAPRRRSYPAVSLIPAIVKTMQAAGSWLAGIANATWTTITTGLTALGRKTMTATTAAHQAIAEGARRTGLRVNAAMKASRLAVLVLFSLAWRLHRPLAIGLSVGVIVGLGCWLAGPIVASTVSGLSGLVLTLTALALRSVKDVLSLERNATGDWC